MGTFKNGLKFAITFVVAGSLGFTAADAPAAKHAFRVQQAKELLGSGYRTSVVKKGENAKDVNKFVLAMTEKLLPKKHKHYARDVASAIQTEADKHGFDPVFVMAVIQNESSFNPTLKGSAGEIGMMQIKPSAAKWITANHHYVTSYKGEKSLYNPVTNIQVGTAILSKLRHQFESESRLYISAYNIGAKKVRSLVSNSKTPGVYVRAVMKRYIALYQAFAISGTMDERIDFAYDHMLHISREVASNISKTSVVSREIATN
jgi:soluble lytic murein transglycosylase-like protein